ncbi:MAG: hypothetical protein U5R48_05710 [Gammaproteobacteria bacterium]|nr:hypothetical protein [Gammaproteobacteria bacterium]
MGGAVQGDVLLAENPTVAREEAQQVARQGSVPGAQGHVESLPGRLIVQLAGRVPGLEQRVAGIRLGVIDEPQAPGTGECFLRGTGLQQRPVMVALEFRAFGDLRVPGIEELLPAPAAGEICPAIAAVPGPRAASRSSARGRRPPRRA